MLERYKFRGKRRDGHGWISGYLSGAAEIDYFDERGYPISRIVISATIGQCTGLKDKHGVLIFEGDIIRVSGTTCGDIRGIAEFGNHTGSGGTNHYGYRVRWLNVTTPLKTDITYWCKRGEIIGNVHDNPELLNR